MSETSAQALEAVRKSVVVQTSPERAFELFTARIGEWWPLRSHSVHGEEAETVVFEAGAGGRVYERAGDGRESTWSRVLVWDPPRRVVLTWEVSAAGVTELELRFRPEGEGTRVDLEHRGWEAYGEGAAGARASYDPGWDAVLARYVEAADGEGPVRGRD